MIEQFTGFRGVAALCQIGDVSFLVLAKNQKQLAAIYQHVMPQAEPMNPDACKKCVCVQANLLPKPTQVV